jgi:hypothetical protein
VRRLRMVAVRRDACAGAQYTARAAPPNHAATTLATHRTADRGALQLQPCRFRLRCSELFRRAAGRSHASMRSQKPGRVCISAALPRGAEGGPTAQLPESTPGQRRRLARGGRTAPRSLHTRLTLTTKLSICRHCTHDLWSHCWNRASANSQVGQLTAATTASHARSSRASDVY